MWAVLIDLLVSLAQTREHWSAGAVELEISLGVAEGHSVAFSSLSMRSLLKARNRR